eukprot:15487355-Heterocapsa_arctica.AAC.1
MVYNMDPFVISCVDAYLELSKNGRSSFKCAATQFFDEDRVAEDCAKDPEVEKGTLQPIASSVLMKGLYAARLARFDLFKTVATLAKKVTKCDKGCDRMLHRLICYINSSLRDRFESARAKIANKGRDSMPAPGD